MDDAVDVRMQDIIYLCCRSLVSFCNYFLHLVNRSIFKTVPYYVHELFYDFF